MSLYWILFGVLAALIVISIVRERAKAMTVHLLAAPMWFIVGMTLYYADWRIIPVLLAIAIIPPAAFMLFKWLRKPIKKLGNAVLRSSIASAKLVGENALWLVKQTRGLFKLTSQLFGRHGESIRAAVNPRALLAKVRGKKTATSITSQTMGGEVQ